MRTAALAALAAAALCLAGCSSLEKRIFSGDPQARAEALAEAGRAAPKARRKLALSLGRRLSHKKAVVRADAASALEDLGPAAADAAPYLIKALGGGDGEVAAAAARILSALPAAAPAVAAALDQAADAALPALQSVLAAQGEPAALALAGNFSKGSRRLALRSAGALALMGPAAAKAVPALARAASSADAEVRRTALAALSAVGAPAGSWLAGALISSSPRSRAGAAALLAAMPRKPPEALDALVGALADQDEKVRSDASAALASFSPEELAALPAGRVPDLAAAAASGPWAAGARLALLRTGKAPGKALLEALYDAEEIYREAAALALILTFPPPREPAAALFEALKDRSVPVRRAAAAAIGNYAVTLPDALPKDAAARLGRALRDADQETARLAALPLGRLAAADPQALETLLGALAEESSSGAATEALEAAGKKAEAALPALWKAFRSRDCARRRAAARALTAVQPALKRNRQVAAALKADCQAAAKPAGKKAPGKPAGRKKSRR